MELNYTYNKTSFNPEVSSVLRKIRDAQLAQNFHPERFETLEAFLLLHPEANPESLHFHAALFSDLEIFEGVDEMWEIANHLMAIRHARPCKKSKEIYMGALAMLMKRDITAGGNKSLFVKRCYALYEEIIEGKQFVECIDRLFYKINMKDWILVYDKLSELRVELPADDIKTIDDFITAIPTVDSKTKSNVKRIFTCLHKRLKQRSQYTKREIHDFSKKAVTHMVKHLRHSQNRRSRGIDGILEIGRTKASNTQDCIKKEANYAVSEVQSVPCNPNHHIIHARGGDSGLGHATPSVVNSELSHTDLIYSPYVLPSPSAAARAGIAAGTGVKVEQSENMSSVSVSAPDSIVTFHNQHQYYQVQFYQDETTTASAAVVTTLTAAVHDNHNSCYDQGNCSPAYYFDLELDEDFCDYWEDDEIVDDEHIAALLREEEQDEVLKKTLDGPCRERITSSSSSSSSVTGGAAGGVVTCENGVDLSIATPISYNEEAAYCSSAVVTAEAVSPVSPIIVASSPLEGGSGKKKKNKVEKAFDDMNKAFKKIGI